MERFKGLNPYQKVILLLVTLLVLAFTVVYPLTLSRVGFAYMGAILTPSQEGETTLYSGRIHWKEASFSVNPEGAVVFRWGDATYGPYTAREDPSAIPRNHDNASSMTGVELFRGEELIFRGGVLPVMGADSLLLIDSEGNWTGDIRVTLGDGTVLDENGNPVDPMEPSPGTLLRLMAGPVLTHKGNWTGWFLGMFCCIVAMVSMLFAEELFRWHMAFRVQNPEDVEPSDWEIAGRYIGWTLMPILALAAFLVGLQ